MGLLRLNGNVHQSFDEILYFSTKNNQAFGLHLQGVVHGLTLPLVKWMREYLI
nr:hypothetical protein [uncultured Methanobacterium sp.]